MWMANTYIKRKINIFPLAHMQHHLALSINQKSQKKIENTRSTRKHSHFCSKMVFAFSTSFASATQKKYNEQMRKWKNARQHSLAERTYLLHIIDQINMVRDSHNFFEANLLLYFLSAFCCWFLILLLFVFITFSIVSSKRMNNYNYALNRSSTTHIYAFIYVCVFINISIYIYL